MSVFALGDTLISSVALLMRDLCWENASCLTKMRHPRARPAPISSIGAHFRGNYGLHISWCLDDSQVKWRSQLLEVGEWCRGRKQLSSSAHWLAKLVCSVAVFTQCGTSATRGHPKGPIFLHNNARKSMKGRSDKGEINQPVAPQVLAF